MFQVSRSGFPFVQDGPGRSLEVAVFDVGTTPGRLAPPARYGEIGKEEQKQEWIWQGYLGPGVKTMLISMWKAGKTTLVGNLVRAMCAGRSDFAELALRPTPVLLITEEAVPLWLERLGGIPETSPVYFASRPFLGQPDAAEWQHYALEMASWCRQAGIRLVVIDPIANLIPGEENSAGAMRQFLSPLEAFTHHGCAVLLLHHPRKSDGSEGRAARGSGFLGGYVDILIEMRRQPTGAGRIRYLNSYSRYGDTPGELVLELMEGGRDYRRISSRLEAELSHLGHVILSLLGQTGEAMTVNELISNWPLSDEETPKLRSLHNLLKAGVDVYWTREGAGTRVSPYRFRAVEKYRASKGKEES